MTVNTYLKRNPNVKEFWLQAGQEVSLCNVNNFDDINNHGNWKIKRVEEGPEGEPVTLHVM